MKKVLLNSSVIFSVLLLFMNFTARAQYTTNKVVGKKDEALKDSLMNYHYPYLLPIWGQKVTAKGFDLPYSAGLSVQYLWQQSDIIINNLQVGFNNGPKYNLDQIVRFDKAQTTSNGVNVRPDVWLFPFLNIYAILAKAKTSTAVDFGVWIPDSSTWHKILSTSTRANFNSTTFGFGLTPTIGVGGFFLALDMNFSWSDIEELDKPAYVFIFGPRLGKNFKFKNKERNLAVWVGGFRVHLDNGTTGNLSASELFPTDQWQAKLDTGYMKVADSQQKVDAWWAGLTPAEQRNPVNAAKYQTANTVLAKTGGLLDQASQVVTNAGSASVQYSLDKTPKDKWNFIIGSQFQLNKSWMLRAEYGFLSSRLQLIVGLQYRFGL